MPRRNLIPIKLPAMQPDCCMECPLVGLIPEGQSRGRYTHVCCATTDALTRRGLRVRASEKDARHPWHRPCDAWWSKWAEACPSHIYSIPRDRYFLWRVPYEHTLELTIKFPSK